MDVRVPRRLDSASVRTEERRREVQAMRKSMADVLKEEGGVETARRILLRSLRTRFGEVPPDTAAVIEVATDLGRLEEWNERVLTAKTLKEVGIPTAS
jgi:hypothetical protein